MPAEWGISRGESEVNGRFSVSRHEIRLSEVSSTMDSTGFPTEIRLKSVAWCVCEERGLICVWCVGEKSVAWGQAQALHISMVQAQALVLCFGCSTCKCVGVYSLV